PAGCGRARILTVRPHIASARWRQSIYGLWRGIRLPAGYRRSSWRTSHFLILFLSIPHGEERGTRVSNHEATSRAFILRDAALRAAPQDEGPHSTLFPSSGSC